MADIEMCLFPKLRSRSLGSISWDPLALSVTPTVVPDILSKEDKEVVEHMELQQSETEIQIDSSLNENVGITSSSEHFLSSTTLIIGLYC